MENEDEDNFNPNDLTRQSYNNFNATDGFNNTMNSAATGNTNNFASTFRSRSTALTAEELRKARESRAAEALRMKDEQLKILSEQNANLLKTIDRLEEEANAIQLEKLSIEQENRNVRDTNFELQSKARAAETIAKRVQIEVADKEKQLRIMTDQNSELLRLLESEESLAARLQGEVNELRAELDELRQKYAALLTTAKTHEELATKAAKEGQLRAEEIRLLRVETEQLKQQNTELKMKTQIEVEALQEQLRVRKEKQYQLLEKLQAQEEAKRQAEDQVAGMEEQLRSLHARNVDLETQNKVESRSKNNVEEANRELQVENNNLINQIRELQSKIDRSEKERLRMEAEARDSGNDLRDMSDKVFQLVERLKLAELGKTKAMEALKKKELDMISLQKKNARLIKESTEEGKARVKAEMDVKVLQEQVRALKKSNTSLAQKSKDEATHKVKIMEEKDQLDEKLKTMESRLSFLLNKVQADEEARVIQAEDRKKLEAQVLSYTEKCEELQQKLTEMGESNRIITQAMRFKQDELNELQNKLDIASKEIQQRDEELARLNGPGGAGGGEETLYNTNPTNGPDDIENVRLNEGRGRFYVEAKSVGGGSLLLLKARKQQYKLWLDKFNVNEFLKRAQKTTRFRDLVVERFAAVYGLLMVEEEEKNQLLQQMTQRDEHMQLQRQKLSFMQESLASEEDAKRRMLLRYIHAVKEHAMLAMNVNNNGGNANLNNTTATNNNNNTMTIGSLQNTNNSTNNNEDGHLSNYKSSGVLSSGGGILQLPESNLGDEEVHALSALLRNNISIEEVNLRNNHISDDGARALAAVLAGKSGLKLLDLRGNKISSAGISTLAEALERSERVKHVYVHAAGKIEALGTGRWAAARSNTNANTSAANLNTTGNVETVCVVDVRENKPEATSQQYTLETLPNMSHSFQANTGGFKPTNVLASTGVPKQSLMNSMQFVNSASNNNNINNNNTTSNKSNKTNNSKEKYRSLNAETAMLENQQQQQLRQSMSDFQMKKNKLKAHEDQLLSLRENNWQGRRAGYDVTSMEAYELNQQVHGRNRKANQRLAILPPLTNNDSANNNNNNSNNSPLRQRSAPTDNMLYSLDTIDRHSPEHMLMGNVTTAAGVNRLHTAPSDTEFESDTNQPGQQIEKKKKKKKKKVSDVQRRIMESPLTQKLYIPNSSPSKSNSEKIGISQKSQSNNQNTAEHAETFHEEDEI